MEGKGAGVLAIVIIWGGLFYLFSAGSAVPGISAEGGNFLATAAASFSGVFGGGSGSSEPFGIVGENGVFKISQAHFKDAVKISQMEFSSSDPSLLFAASDRGLFASKDAGSNWYPFSDVEHKLDSSMAVYKILFNPENKKESFVSVFANGKGVIYRSENNFFSVEKIIELDNEAVYDFDIKNNNLYLGLSNGKLISFSLNKNESRVLTSFSSPIVDLEIPAGGNLMYLSLKSGALYLSYDSGMSFSRLKYASSYGGKEKINDFLVSPENSFSLYVATNSGLISSSDAGTSWKVFKTLPLETAAVSAVALKSTGEIFAASNGKIYKSHDNGLNWQTVETNFGVQISTMVFSGNRVIIGTGNKK